MAFTLRRPEKPAPWNLATFFEDREEIILQIASSLSGIEDDDLTVAERQIVRILETNGYLEENDDVHPEKA